MKLTNILLFTVIYISLIANIKSDTVCSEFELVRELKEDLADNGKLDCLRESIAIPGEDAEKKKIRQDADWEGDCSFESESDTNPWTKRLFENYPLIRGMIDVNGNHTNDLNQPDQADMCEIIRTLIGNNMIEGITIVGDGVTSLNEDISYYIDCPGGGTGSGSPICAATAGSFADPKGWYIFLDGQSITLNGKPQYEASKN